MIFNMSPMSNPKTKIFKDNRLPNQLVDGTASILSRVIPTAFWLLGLLVLAAVGARLSYHFRPIPPRQVRAVLPAGLVWAQERDVPADALWVDARLPAEYVRGHHAGALNLSLLHWDSQFLAFAKVWRPGRPIAIYCDEGCRLSIEVGVRIKQAIPVAEIFVLEVPPALPLAEKP